MRRCSSSDPSTLTKTVACARSVVACTPVTVTKPIRGSFKVGTGIREHLPDRLVHLRFDAQRSPGTTTSRSRAGARSLRPEVADDGVEQVLQLTVLACRARHGERRALPQVVVIHLYGNTEPLV